MQTVDLLKSQAKRLRTHFASKGKAITHSEALEAIAAISGFKDWNTAIANVNATSGTPAVRASDDVELVSAAMAQPDLLTIFVTEAMTPDELEAEVELGLRNAPAAVRFRIDSTATLEQLQMARRAATGLKDRGYIVQVDLP